MKVALIADIHANLIALEAVMERLNSCDEVICAGDVVGYYPYFNEVIELLRRERVHSIIGNHDYAVLTGDTSNLDAYGKISANYTMRGLDEKNKDWLESRPYQLQTEYFNVYHGSPFDGLDAIFVYIFPTFPFIDKILEEEGKSVVVGHTHVQFERRYSRAAKGLGSTQNLSLTNPGSVGQPRDGDSRAAYAIFDTERDEFSLRRVGYDIEEVYFAVHRAGLPIVQALRLFEGV
jgi:predicted phosphodiesterase